MIFFSPWLKNFAQVQENMRLQFGSASDRARTNFARDKTTSTSFGATSDSISTRKPSERRRALNLAVQEVQEKEAGRTT